MPLERPDPTGIHEFRQGGWRGRSERRKVLIFPAASHRGAETPNQETVVGPQVFSQETPGPHPAGMFSCDAMTLLLLPVSWNPAVTAHSAQNVRLKIAIFQDIQGVAN